MNPYAILGGLLLALALYFGGTSVGKRLERAKWQEKELATAAKTEAQLVAAQDKYVRLKNFNEATARKASADHEKAISDLTRQYDAARAAIRAAGGMRVSRSICASPDNGATAAPGAGRPDDPAAGTVALPPDVEAKLLQLTQEADALAERLRALQMWIKGAGLYGPADELPAAPAAK